MERVIYQANHFVGGRAAEREHKTVTKLTRKCRKVNWRGERKTSDFFLERRRRTRSLRVLNGELVGKIAILRVTLSLLLGIWGAAHVDDVHGERG